jgi:hypothetical protein
MHVLCHISASRINTYQLQEKEKGNTHAKLCVRFREVHKVQIVVVIAKDNYKKLAYIYRSCIFNIVQ